MKTTKAAQIAATAFLAFLYSCGGDSPSSQGGSNCPSVQETKQAATQEAEIYVENSASMFGYLEGQTEFKSVLMDLPFRIKDKGQKTSFYFINDQPYPIDKEFKTFIESLNTKTAQQYGKTNMSALDLMLELIVDKAIKSNKMAVFASDFVYDVVGKKPIDELQGLERKIQNTVAKLKTARAGWGLLVLRFSSQFNGTYYDLNDKKVQLKGDKRPYYLWVIAPSQQLKDFEKDYNISNLAGYELAALYQSAEDSQPYFSILPQTDKIGEFQRSAKKGAVAELSAVEGKAGSREFQLNLAVDLSQVGAAEAYLSDKSNYTVESNLGLEITNISPIASAKIHPNDQRWKCTATHVITLHTAALKFGNDKTQQVKLRLLQKSPQWVDNYHLADDSDIKANLPKSFGLKNLMQGVEKGFNPNLEAVYHCGFSFTLNK